MAALGQLAAGVAHEVNNPLGVLALNLSAFDGQVDDPRLKKRVELMRTAVKRGRQTIERLLNFAHPARATRREFPLHELLAETLELVRRQMELLEIELVSRLEPVWLDGDAAQLSQVFLNLLFNARDSLAGSPRPRRLELACRHHWVRISDNGQGMTPEVRKRVFEPFFTTKEVGQGVGLGLAISYQILKEHQATVAITSEPNQGASFLITFEEKLCRPES